MSNTDRADVVLATEQRQRHAVEIASHRKSIFSNLHREEVSRARVITREKTCYSSYFDAKQADGQEVVCSYNNIIGATLVATGRVLYLLPPLEKILTPFEKILTPFEKILTPFKKILPPFGKILPPFEKILTPFGEILPLFGETPSPSVPVATIVAPKRVL